MDPKVHLRSPVAWRGHGWKGLLKRRSAGRAYIYEAVSSREAYTADVMREPLAASGNRAATLVHFLERLTPEEASASAVLSAFAAAVPASVVGHGLADLFEVCAALLHDRAALSSAGTVAGLVAGALVLVRVAWTGTAVLFRARRERRRPAAALALLGRHDLDLDAVVVDYDERLAYCLPGRNGHAVITTGALHSLTPEQVAAVLAHEQAHLRGRHHLVLAGTEALARAFPLGRRERIAGRLAVTALLTTPAALALTPGVMTFLTHHCHSLLTFY